MKDPALHATTRDGYYPPGMSTQSAALVESPKQAKAQLQLDISSAVTSAMSYNGLEIVAAKDGAEYVLRVKSKGLEWRRLDSSTERAEVSAIAAWYNEKGQVLGHIGQELTSIRPTASAPSMEPSAVFRLAVPATPAGATRLRFVLRDAISGHIGTVDFGP